MGKISTLVSKLLTEPPMQVAALAALDSVEAASLRNTWVSALADSSSTILEFLDTPAGGRFTQFFNVTDDQVALCFDIYRLRYI